MRRLTSAAIVIVVVALLAWWWFGPRAAAIPRDTAAATTSATAAPESPRASTSSAAVDAPRKRARLPRPVGLARDPQPDGAPRAPAPNSRPAPPSAAPVAGAGDSDAPRPRAIRVSELGGQVRDRRADPGEDAPSEIELVQAGLETVSEDVEACLREWSTTDAQVGAAVMIGFRLDADGLTESWVDGASELPFGVQTCFANAVYGVDWSHVVRKPAEITQRFEVEEE